jgi:hypothetical protein
LADAVRGVEAAAATVKSEVRILIRKDLRLAGPEGVSYLETLGGVRSAEFTGLDEEGEKSGDEQE